MRNMNSSIPVFVQKAIMIASLGGILFGYDMGVISFALPQLANEFELSSSQKEKIVSFLFIGGAIGAAIGGTICDTIGRKKAIFITDIMFIIGAFILSSSQTFLQILIGRIIVGFAVAVSGIADVAYLHEISPVKYRGAIVSVNEACISLGFLISYIVGYAISQWNEVNGWRYMFGLGSCIAVFQFVGMIFMPESPIWLRSNGRSGEAEIVFGLIRQDDDDKVEGVSMEMMGVNQSNEIENNETIEDYGLDQNNGQREESYQTSSKGSNANSREITRELMMSPSQDSTENLTSENGVLNAFLTSYRQALIAAFLASMQQFCGHPNVLNFAPEIFEQVGVASLFSTVLVGILKFIVTCFVIWKIEHFGRKYLLILGMGSISISLFLLSVAFSSRDDEGGMPIFPKILAIVGIFGVAGGYACSFGPLVWLLVSELFHSSIRGRALGASTIITYLAGAIVSNSFLTVQDTFGEWVPFVIYCILTFLSIIFVALAIPETSNKDPESIHVELTSLWWWQKRESEFENSRDIDISNRVV